MIQPPIHMTIYKSIFLILLLVNCINSWAITSSYTRSHTLTSTPIPTTTSLKAISIEQTFLAHLSNYDPTHATLLKTISSFTPAQTKTYLSTTLLQPLPPDPSKMSDPLQGKKLSEILGSLVDRLERSYVPCHTPGFYSILSSGNYRLLHSHSSSSSSDSENIKEISQNINFASSTAGNLQNVVDWTVGDCHGTLRVNCKFEVRAAERSEARRSEARRSEAKQGEHDLNWFAVLRFVRCGITLLWKMREPTSALGKQGRT